jgi:carboxyl-terminal processing protease
VVLFLGLGLAVYLAAPAAFTAPPQAYESLRLITEAISEISQKFVFQKPEEEMIQGALRGMMSSLDPDSSYLTPQEYQNYLKGQKTQTSEAGLEVIFKDHLLTVASAMDGGPAARAGLKPGDNILKINGQMVRNLTAQEASRRFQGAPGTSLTLQVLRNGLVKPLDLTVTLEPLGPGSVTSQVIKDAYAYIRVRQFNDDTPRELAAALKELQRHKTPLKGVILDLRNNARGTLEQAVRTTAEFLGEKEIVSTKGRRVESSQTYSGKVREPALKTPLPMVVLVDQGTARAAEIVAGALRDQGEAVLLGTKTLGLCGLTKALPLQDGSALVMTVAQCYTPKGQKIQNKGLEPGVAGQTPPAPAATAKEQPRTPTPDQDPWVLQAVELLKSGKARQAAN